MSKVKREAPKNHLMLVDTNILWHHDKHHPVCPEFDDFWNKYSLSTPLKLVLPAVVLGELQFQQTTSAVKALEKVTELFKEISGIAESKYNHKIGQNDLKSQVEAKLARWIKTRDADIAETPITKIDWAKITQQAIWRLPPFSYDPKNPKNEKGFRDALILETVIEATLNASAGTNVVFVSDDNLLRETAEKRLQANKNFLPFESLPDFAAYLELTKENLTNKFVKEIQVRARAKFYSKGDPNCLYAKEKIRTRILEEFKEITEPAVPTNTGAVGFFTPYTATWELLKSKLWIRATQFVSLAGDREFHWKTTVQIVRLYKENLSNPPGLIVVPPTTSQQRLLVAPFEVFWCADVKADGRFHSLELKNIAPAASSTFLPTTEEALKEWGMIDLPLTT